MSGPLTATLTNTPSPFASENRTRTLLLIVAAFAVLAGAAWLLSQVWHDDEAIKSWLTGFLGQDRGTPWALPIVIAAYIVAGLVFFPIILLNLVVAMVFGLWGILYGIVGIMANAALFFFLGQLVRDHGGKKWLEKSKFKWVDEKLNQIGLAGLVAIHAFPAPPFVLTNVIAGISSVPAGVYLLGTFLAMLPGAIARGVMGESIVKVFLNPTPETWMWLAGGVVLWAVMVGGAHMLLKHYGGAAKTQ